MPFYGNSGQFGAGMQNPQYQQSPWLVDPTNAIQSGQNDIRRGMNQNMNNVASRLGAQGMIGANPTNSGVYAQQLGNVATDASKQMADVTNKYSYDAANQNANRFLSAQQQQQALQQDWWARYYDALKSGGSADYMQQWQNAGIPQAQQYAKATNPWL
jgi:hypothetical protein